MTPDPLPKVPVEISAAELPGSSLEPRGKEARPPPGAQDIYIVCGPPVTVARFRAPFGEGFCQN